MTRMARIADGRASRRVRAEVGMNGGGVFAVIWFALACTHEDDCASPTGRVGCKNSEPESVLKESCMCLRGRAGFLRKRQLCFYQLSSQIIRVSPSPRRRAGGSRGNCWTRPRRCMGGVEGGGWSAPSSDG